MFQQKYDSAKPLLNDLIQNGVTAGGIPIRWKSDSMIILILKQKTAVNQFCRPNFC
jgi:hypothetical protein